MPFIPNGGGFLVSSFKRQDRSHGILSAVEPVYLEDPHWQAGLEWETDCSVEASSTLPPCPEALEEKAVDGGLLFCTAEPFTVMGSYKCSTGGRTAIEALNIATNRLRMNKEKSIERIFWTGTSAVGNVNPSLQGGNSSCGITPINLTPEDCPLSPVDGIAALESSIVECVPGGIGVIHLNFGVLAYIAAAHLLREVDGKFYTPTGQLIVAGAGYPGSGPSNIPSSPGTTWLFATGPLAVFASDIFFTPPHIDQAVERLKNDITFFAEQTFSVVWDCCVFAVQIEI